MKTSLHLGALACLALLTFNHQLSIARAQGTAFTYQGRLNDGGAPANGSYDLQFILYNAGVGGSQQGPIPTSASRPNQLELKGLVNFHR